MRLIVFLFALLTTTSSAQTLDPFAWLKGCWRTQGDGPVITEVWLAPPVPAMLGYSYTVGDGETRGWEQMRIERTDDGAYFVAMPNGGAPVRFRLTHVGGGDPSLHGWRATFANPEHDYPQQVSYHRLGDTLTAEIARSDGSDRVTFRYRRIRCPANLRP